MKRIILLMAMCFSGWAAMANPGGVKISKVEDMGKGMQKVTWFYDDGTVAEEGFYLDGLKTGTWTSFNEKGQKTAIANWARDKKDGDCYIMHDNGQVKFKVVYSNNKKVTAYEWDESGTLLANQ